MSVIILHNAKIVNLLNILITYLCSFVVALPSKIERHYCYPNLYVIHFYTLNPFICVSFTHLICVLQFTNLFFWREVKQMRMKYLRTQRRKKRSPKVETQDSPHRMIKHEAYSVKRNIFDLTDLANTVMYGELHS